MVAMVIVGLTLVSPTMAQTRKKAVTHKVTIDSTSFVPAVLDIKVGDSVVWENKDIVAHTATAKGTFESGAIQSGKSWKRTFTTKADLEYLCRYHPTMKGRVRVQ